MIKNAVKLPKGNLKGIDAKHPFVHHDKNVILKPGNVSLDPQLGAYYIDMSPAIVHYTDHHYGQFDDKGVSMNGFGKYADYYHINIAQYGFILHDIYIKDKSNKDVENVLFACLEWFENNKEEYKDTTCWRCTYYNKKYDLDKGWVSAMAQGEIISFYLRMYQLTQKKELLDTAIKAYEFMKIEVKDGGIRSYDENGYLWLEEYPSKPASYVLNGFIYAIFGLYDVYRVTNRGDVKKDIDSCIETLKNNLHKYDVGYWSLYDQLLKELVQVYYQKNVHVPQMQVLHMLTNDSFFLEYQKKWENTLNPINILFVKLMYRFLTRWNKLKKLISRN